MYKNAKTLVYYVEYWNDGKIRTWSSHKTIGSAVKLIQTVRAHSGVTLWFLDNM